MAMMGDASQIMIRRAGRTGVSHWKSLWTTRGGIDTFGLNPSAVFLRVVNANGVVEPVAEDGAENGANDGGEVDEA